MTGVPALASVLEEMSAADLRSRLAAFVPDSSTAEERTAAVETALNGPYGQAIRMAAGQWIADHIVAANKLVPAVHARWVPVVRDAMLYVVHHLSAHRLAPKLLVQLELSERTRPETRLLLLISEVPGLQKLGQVLARNRNLGASLRRALITLENSIRDVKATDIYNLIHERLGERIRKFEVRFRPHIFSEASVSAIVRFTWKNPETGRRERGVFKVLKPYIPDFFAEDMQILQGLSEYFGSRLDEYGFSGDVLSDTFTKVRRLLEHEVDFPGEQRTLRDAYKLYRSMPGVRIPRLISELCSPDVTAMTEEQGIKITTASQRLTKSQRSRLSERVVEALVGLPLFSSEREALFHADPHAGNLFYDRKNDQIVILDWALVERLSRDQRRHLALLFGFVTLRDRISVAQQIEALRQTYKGRNGHPSDFVRSQVDDFLDNLPLARLPGAVDAMQLLERLAMNGVKFPAPLIMLSKVLVTLDGVLTDLGASRNCMGIGIARHLLRQSVTHYKLVSSPIKPIDWIALQCSVLLYFGRVWIRWQELLLQATLAPPANASSTRIS